MKILDSKSIKGIGKYNNDIVCDSKEMLDKQLNMAYNRFNFVKDLIENIKNWNTR